MAGKFDDLFGTLRGIFKLGIGGPQLKNNAGAIQARNTTDAAFVALQALLFQTYGNDFELNAGATGTGADRRFTLRRPSTGMTEDITLVMPATPPTAGQALTVASFSAGVATLQWSTIAGGNDKPTVDTTAIAFGTASPITMLNLPANAVVLNVSVIVDTPFNGTPSLSIGISGSTSKYMPSTQIDLTAAAGTLFSADPGLIPVGSIEAIIGTYAAGGATAGAGRMLVEYAIPS
jgi:hypothetical protein